MFLFVFSLFVFLYVALREKTCGETLIPKFKGSFFQKTNFIYIDFVLWKTLTGHPYGVNSVTFDAYDMIASSSWDTIKIWNKNTGDLLRTITVNVSYVVSIAFDANDMIASVSSDGTIQLWNKNTGELFRTLIGYGSYIDSLDFDVHKNPVTSAASDDVLQYGSIPPHMVITFAFDDNYMLASSSWDNTLKLWNKNTGTLLRTLTGHDHYVSSVVFDANVMIASGSFDRTIRLWNKNTGDMLRSLTGHGDWVISLAFDANEIVASGSWDGVIKLWNKNTGYVK